MHNARYDIKNWTEVSDVAKDRIVAYMLEIFQLPDTQHNRDTILTTANNLYKYRRSSLHDHFKKYATKEKRLQNMPTDANEAEWKFLVEYFDSDTFKRISERNKTNKANQEMNQDKVNEYIAEQIQEIEEDTDLDPIVNVAFVKVVGETSSYCWGQGSGVKK